MRVLMVVALASSVGCGRLGYGVVPSATDGAPPVSTALAPPPSRPSVDGPGASAGRTVCDGPCRYTCSNQEPCIITVGPGSTVSCANGSGCEVWCTSDCLVVCSGGGGCWLHPSGAGSVMDCKHTGGNRVCAGDVVACGRTCP